MGGLEKHRFLICVLLFCSSLVQVAICVSLKDDPAIRRFREYLQIPTMQPNPDYEPVFVFLRGQADDIGLSATIFEFVAKKPIMVTTWEGFEPSLPSIPLNSHTGFSMSVQPAEEAADFDIRVPPSAEVASALERRISEEWTPPSRNWSFYYEQNFETDDGQPSVTKYDNSNPWWFLLKQSLRKFNGILLLDICTASTGMQFLRKKEIGFTTIQDTPQLVHDNNDVGGFSVFV